MRSKDSAILFKLRLGKAVGPMKEGDGCYTREFERGLIAVSSDSRSARLTIPGGADMRVLDVYEARHLKPSASGGLDVELPPGCGRVYLFH